MNSKHPIFRGALRHATFVCFVLAGLGFIASAPAKKSAGDRSEVKLVIQAERAAAAAATLGLAEKTPAPLEVLFFDTKDAALQARHLILRVRHKAGTPGESTVKLRMTSGEDALSQDEESIPAEAEWTNADVPLMSRALNYKIPPDQYNAVLHSGASAETLFSGKQRRLVESRLPNFSWPSLVAHGPVQGEVWDRQCQLKGFPIAISVERWHMQKDGKNAEILEISAKVKSGSEADAKEMASSFFQAAEAAGFGPPNSLTKTQVVLDFFRTSPAEPVTK
jgi:CYTH domain